MKSSQQGWIKEVLQYAVLSKRRELCGCYELQRARQDSDEVKNVACVKSYLSKCGQYVRRTNDLVCIFREGSVVPVG